jgi:DNA polymerase-3 subunit delta'
MTSPSTMPTRTDWNILGHTWAVDMLRQHIVRDAVRHAYLFAGPPGVGRRTLALRFAQALNCTQPVQPGIPCGGVCRDCRQIESGGHPDVTFIQAEAEGGTLKVDQIRDPRWSLNLKPYQSKYRVGVFLRFQEASDGAANALLKTLEEPPSYAVLILTADSPEALPPTIVSRCEVLRLPSLQLEVVDTFLKQRGADDAQARLISHVSGGRPGFALSLLHDKAALAYRDEKLTELQSLLPATRSQKFTYAEKLARDKASMRRVLTLWLSFWRDVLWRASGASTPLANIDHQQEIEALAHRIGLSRTRQIVSSLDRAVGRLETSVNARLLAEVLLLDWPQ